MFYYYVCIYSHQFTIRYRAAKEEFAHASTAAQSACISALRGMLGSTFPIIRNRYQIGVFISYPPSHLLFFEFLKIYIFILNLIFIYF